MNMDTQREDVAGDTTPATMTIDEVARMHRVSRRTVERWIADGHLPVSKLPGGFVRIERSAAEALAAPVEVKP